MEYVLGCVRITLCAYEGEELTRIYELHRVLFLYFGLYDLQHWKSRHLVLEIWISYDIDVLTRTEHSVHNRRGSIRNDYSSARVHQVDLCLEIGNLIRVDNSIRTSGCFEHVEVGCQFTRPIVVYVVLLRLAWK